MLGTDTLYNDLRHMMPGMADLRGAVFSPDGQDPARMAGRARSLSGKGRFAEAADGAIAAAPGYAHVKATATIQTDRYEESVECLDDVLPLKPGDTDGLRIKGMLPEGAGRPEGAPECYDGIIRIAPGDMSARYPKCGALASIEDAGWQGATARRWRQSRRAGRRACRLVREESGSLALRGGGRLGPLRLCRVHGGLWRRGLARAGPHGRKDAQHVRGEGQGPQGGQAPGGGADRKGGYRYRNMVRFWEGPPSETSAKLCSGYSALYFFI